MKDVELKKNIEDHRHWVVRDCDGWESKRAVLTGADLREANLIEADLRYAYLIEADLSGADLRYAYLREADLSGANLSGANLSGANLRYADLSGANLNGVDLSGADLIGADLSGANLSGANLNGANLSGANLIEAQNLPFIPIACPECGEFIAWKKANGRIVKLLIPSDAGRSSATGRKCRASKAKVLSIENVDGTDSGLSSIESSFDRKFIYRIGETVKVNDFCEDRFKECAAGIHFFINRQEAVDY